MTMNILNSFLKETEKAKGNLVRKLDLNLKTISFEAP